MATEPAKVAHRADEAMAQARSDLVRAVEPPAAQSMTQSADVDLLVSTTKPLNLMQLGRLEQQIANLLNAPVDLVPESALRPDLPKRVHAEALSL